MGVVRWMEEVAENGWQIWERMREVFTPLSAYSFLLFNLLCAPCPRSGRFAEMNNWRWTTFAIVYQTVLAYVVSLIVYQLGMLFTEWGVCSVRWWRRATGSATVAAVRPALRRGRLVLRRAEPLVEPTRPDSLRRGSARQDVPSRPFRVLQSNSIRGYKATPFAAFFNRLLSPFMYR